MAGLSRNFLIKQKAFPDDPPPSYDSTFMNYMGSGMGSMSGTTYYPGFANDDGNYYNITMDRAGSTTIEYKNGTNTQITDGVWNGKFNASEVNDGGGNSGNYFTGMYMDTTDNLLYTVVQNTSPSTDQYALASVNKAGTATLIGGSWRSYQAGDSGANTGINASWVMPLRRTGGDGSGNFEMINWYTPSNYYRGIKYTFNVSTGAMTEADVMPAGSVNLDIWYGATLGPTSNNIILGVYDAANSQDSDYMRGWLMNTSTGAHTHRYTTLANGISGGGMSTIFHGPSSVKATYWRGKVMLGNTTNNHAVYEETDLFNYIDQMADFYGIL